MRKYLFVALLALTTVIVSLLPHAAVESELQSLRYSPEICPASKNSTQIVVAGASSKVQLFRGKNSKMVGVKKDFTILTPLPKEWLEISESSGAPILVDRSEGLSLLACPGIAEPAWFVGGSSDIASQDQLVLANDGASAATLLVKMWSNQDRPLETAITVGARTSRSVRLDTLAPGVKSMVLYIEPQVGRVSIALQSKRKTGFKSGGADYISSSAAPSLEQIIPIVIGVKKSAAKKPATKLTKKKVKKAPVVPQTSGSIRTLRVLAPGESGATFTATLLASDGSYIPVGLDGILLEAGRVKEFTFTASVPLDLSALRISSDAPVVASVNNDDVDYAWSPSVGGMEKESALLVPPKGILALIASRGSSVVLVKAGSRGVTSLAVTTEKLTTWVNESKNWALIQVSSDGTVHGSILLTDSTGIALLPIRNRVRVGSGSMPISDLSVTRGGASLPTSG